MGEDVDLAALDHRGQGVSPALLALGTGVVGNLPPRAVIPYPDVRLGPRRAGSRPHAGGSARSQLPLDERNDLLPARRRTEDVR